ncbi:hypothetical protein [Bradyrhizobium sp. CCBAU 53380]|uniref:hypothetical protein n=1 Tax=Bradyrhizobium sp. CCBAU 53380 TaxID=1325117 RepID=UPI002303E238|nr:hypothetical protein [Bradyrhizobium sp. CCBAU 53380]MDA9420970.1 hypothetical protein [Bradyrhizobium sp. CCBAU 53380]
MKLPSDAPRFVATVGPPYPDESLMGYLTRALSVATVDHLAAALRIAGAAKPNPTFIATTLKDQAEIARIAHLIGCRPKEILDRTHPIRFTQTKRKMVVMDFFGTEIRPRHKVTKVRRVSPRALQIAQYHRAIWDLRAFSFDPQTRELLIDTCPVCKRPLGWRRALGPTVCDKCVGEDGLPTVDLRDFEQPIIEVADFGLAGLKENGPLKINVAHIPQLTPELLCLAGRAIIGGRRGFDALCERFRLATGKRAGRHGRLRELGRLAELSNSESSLDPEMREIFGRMIASNLTSTVEAELGDSEGKLSVLPITRLATEVGVRPERLRRLSRSGSVPVVRADGAGKLPVRMAVNHVAPIARYLSDALHPGQAALMIGAPIYAVGDLADHGLIERLEPPVAAMLGATVAYSRASVEALIEKLQGAALKCSSGESVTMTVTRLRTGTMPWGAIVKAVLDNPSTIGWDPKLKTFRLRKLRVIDPSGFARAVRRHINLEEPGDEEWIGPAEAAEVLKITYAFFWRLARAKPDLVQRRREGSAPYLLADIQALSETYIFVSEIAFRRDLHPRLVVHWLRTMGVEAEFSVRKKQDLAFVRGQVEPVLERWNRKDISPRDQRRIISEEKGL